MKVLLLDPKDNLRSVVVNGWDLIIDLGRAPCSVYRLWEQWAGCEVRSLHDLAVEVDDLYHARDLLQTGMAQLIDRTGIDWWDVLSLEILPELLLMTLARRQAENLERNCELYTTRPGVIARAIADLLGTKLRIAGRNNWVRKFQDYRNLLWTLDGVQVAHILEDQVLKGRFGGQRFGDDQSRTPVILLPSAYINGSRTAIELARAMPDEKFLLIFTRSSGRLRAVPGNVSIRRLAVNSSFNYRQEVSELLAEWRKLNSRLASAARELKVAGSVGVLNRVATLLPLAISYRNAWQAVFETANIDGCFCTDDSNFLTRIPLIIARNRGLRTLACHHGALDYFMAVKTRYADFHVAKTALERDYLQRVCHLPPGEITDFLNEPSPPASHSAQQIGQNKWLVFFSEPYQDKYWRSEEVYADLLPALAALAEKLGLELVIKIHPFESIRAHRRRLRQHLPKQEAAIRVIAGPPTEQLWNSTAVCLTVQSTTALECARREIPVFFCAWLRDAFSGYLAQFVRFGVGHPLESTAQLASVPAILERTRATQSSAAGMGTLGNLIEPLVPGAETVEVNARA